MRLFPQIYSITKFKHIDAIPVLVFRGQTLNAMQNMSPLNFQTEAVEEPTVILFNSSQMRVISSFYLKKFSKLRAGTLSARSSQYQTPRYYY
jgi:hypothetical protein